MEVVAWRSGRLGANSLTCAELLFPDAEVAEDVLEDILAGDGADDVAKVVGAFADVLRQKVARESGIESFLHTANGLLRMAQRLVVAHVADYDFLVVDVVDTTEADKQLLQLVEMDALAG